MKRIYQLKIPVPLNHESYELTVEFYEDDLDNIVFRFPDEIKAIGQARLQKDTILKVLEEQGKYVEWRKSQSSSG